MIVVDASAIVDLILRTPLSSSLERLLFGTDDELHAPQLLDLEVAQVLRRYAASGSLSDHEATLRLTAYRDIRIEKHGHDMLLERIWELRENLTAYDAAYVSLSELLEAPLVTTDARLARSSGHTAKIYLP